MNSFAHRTPTPTLARMTFGDPIEDRPQPLPPYTPAQPRPAYQAALAHLQAHRAQRLDTALQQDDADTIDTYTAARIMPALLVTPERPHPATLPALVTGLIWTDDEVIARLTLATPEGDLIRFDAPLLRRLGGRPVPFAPVITLD